VEKTSVLERYLCYRALLLAILGKDYDSEAIKVLLRAKNTEQPVAQAAGDR